MISSYEKQYVGILRDIYENGFSDGINERTGLETKRLPMQSILVDVEKEFPILKSKQVFAKTAEREILWIWQQMSNNIKDLKAKIWNEWADSDGSIGKAYGYQIAKPVKINEGSWDKPNYREYPNQTSFILDYLKEFPNGRHANTTLWNVAELSEMNLVPCVYGTEWNLNGGRLNLHVSQRSGDIPYGVPFNTTQYAMLQCMFAKHLGVKPGILLHTIADAHIYANQMEGVKEQLKRYALLEKADSFYGGSVHEFEEFVRSIDFVLPDNVGSLEFMQVLKDAYNSEPEFCITGANSFWDMNVDNARIVNYKHLGRIDFGDIAV